MSDAKSNVIPLREQRRAELAPSEGKASMFQGVKVERPKCDASLSSGAKKHFKFIADQLEESGLIAKIDKGAIELLAVAYDGWMTAQKEIYRLGGIIEAELQETPNGYTQVSALSVLASRYRSDYEKLQKQFGITVRARQSIKIDNPNQGDLDL